MEPNVVHHGDARTMSKTIPDGSVDLIFTDPPYLSEHLPLYNYLSSTGARVLKPGRYLFAYGAAHHLPDHLIRLGQYLQYFWTFVLMHRNNPRMWSKKLMSMYKPVMVYTNGPPIVERWMGTVHTDQRDKRFHEWGQGVGLAIKVIELLTEPGDTVFDPFCGGGTTATVCKLLGRNFITCDIDPGCVSTTKARLATFQPMLPIEYGPIVQQLPLIS